MSDFAVTWTLISFLLLSFVLIIVLWSAHRNLNARLMQSLTLMDELHKISIAQKQEIQGLLQAQSAVKHDVEQKQDEMNRAQEATMIRLEKVEDTIDRLEEQDPALKMYSKASKLVEQGVAMEDIMEASGLPRAEVEVLLSLHSRKS
ncbi:DUF2802 domain-containing protein [Glaciecola sp. XM2]|jgi:hypothetical protein|uniref:DUF2802 domain-containing protein n=1 Tax=Glaciecola sp. XM2 TaxID=1914931 RepID=UPI001BDF2A1F|nr:DUF2802 domain-containing protein [Glaciecola sp. XM2]MBT1450848.1 DUF2802 domain-containing protein [Glaciecola sp. XM2]